MQWPHIPNQACQVKLFAVQSYVPEVLDANVLHFVALLDFKLLVRGTDLDVANCKRKRRGVPSDHLSEYRHKRLSGIALVSLVGNGASACRV